VLETGVCGARIYFAGQGQLLDVLQSLNRLGVYQPLLKVIKQNEIVNWVPHLVRHGYFKE
jgi:hypothetical protein